MKKESSIGDVIFSFAMVRKWRVGWGIGEERATKTQFGL